LREALYAQQQLPSITNWDSIIANRPLADVIQTVLGLPEAFGALNVTQQVQVLSSRMNIADFQNPTKLSALLDQFVAMSQSQAQGTSQSAAVQLLNSSSSSNGIINLTLPTTPLPDTLASNTAVTLLQSTATG
jgi:Zn-dependent M16 (insulinase) family peptidase